MAEIREPIMNPLTASERDKFARHLSYSATIGGWFLIGMGIFTGVLFLLPLFGILNNNNIEYDPALIGGLIPLLLAFFVPGIWLLRRRRKIRAQLDEPLLTGTADVAQVSGPDPYSGYTTNLRVKTPSGGQKESTLNSYAKPPWQSGERIQLLFTADESHFFPRHLDINMNLGRLYTPQQTTNRQRWKTVFWLIVGGLVLIGFSIGFYEGITGQ